MARIGCEAAATNVSQSLSSVQLSPPPAGLTDGDQNGHHGNLTRVTETMVEEEKRMQDEALSEERERNMKLEKEREEDTKQGEEVLDTKFKRLQYLLGQSEVYSSILISKMQEQREAAKAAYEKKEQKSQQDNLKEDEPSKPAQPVRKTTRAAAAANQESNRTVAGQKAGNIQATKIKKLPDRAKKQKNNDLSISDYFQNKDIDAKANEASVTEALKQAANEQGANSTTLGAQELRSAQQPDLVTGGVMRPYQLEGLEWLTSLYENGLNGILADEMGLGKTIQAISFLAFLRSKGTYGPFLIAAPLSTLSNWVEEFERWTPSIPVILYHGTKEGREALRRKKLVKQGSPEFPVVCTSYEICMNDRKYLAKFNWKFIIIDEGHRLKNLNCRLIRELKSYNSANRLLITGTPLQNNLAELWSLLNFLMPDIFDQLEAFESWFDFSALKDKDGHKEIIVGERKNHVISSLHAILKPFLLRRVKTDVETSLPKKREYILYAPMTTTQKDLYRHILEGDSRAYLEEKVVERMNARNGARTPNGRRSGSLKRNAGSDISPPSKSAKSSRGSTPASSIRSRSGKKRKDYRELSDAEYFKQLADGTEAEVTDTEEDLEELERARTIALAKKEISNKKLQNPIMQLRLACDSPHNFYWPWDDHSPPDKTLISESGKMLLLDRLMTALLAKNHKVLIFSQFKTQLDILEVWASDLQDWRTCRIDGQVKQEERRAQIHAFNSDPAYRIFLLSTRAGGQGINLAAADTVVLFDSDWNPQQDLQAQDRAHRIGQTRNVVVYRLATKGTVEQTLLEKADGKRRLEKLVIQKGKFKSLLGGRSREDLDELQRILMQDEFEKVELGDADVAGEQLLSERDLEILTDRSDEAYVRAEKGLDGGEGFRVVETKKDGNGILGEVT